MPNYPILLTAFSSFAASAFLFYLVSRRKVDAITKLEKQLADVIRARDEHLSAICHELRTPAAVILGYAEIMASPETSDTERRRALDIILRNSKIQSRLIEDLFDISDPAHSRLILRESPQDLVKIIEESLESMQLAAKRKEIQLVSSFDLSGRFIMGDSDRLTQILCNVLSNAVKFTPNGGKISVLHRRIGSVITVEIEDTGVGIRPEFLPHVFDRFCQDETIHKRFGGLGLGLGIAKVFVELHDGQIQVASLGPGKGAKCSITFPCKDVLEPKKV